MKNILILLFFLPIFSYSQTFHYTKIVTGKDTVEKKGLFLVKDFGKAVEYVLFPKPSFGIDEFLNISFLVFDNRTFISTKDLVYFKDFLDTDYFIKYETKIVVGTRGKEIQFLK